MGKSKGYSGNSDTSDMKIYSAYKSCTDLEAYGMLMKSKYPFVLRIVLKEQRFVDAHKAAAHLIVLMSHSFAFCKKLLSFFRRVRFANNDFVFTQGEDFPEENAKRPHVALAGVHFIKDALWCHPL